MANTVSRTLSDETLNRIIQIESAGNPNAHAPTSSAAGLGQFIESTWNATVRKHRPALTVPSRVGTATAAFQIEMLARFTEDNARALGAGYTDGDLYLAHFLGLGDARSLLRAPPGDAAADHVSAGAVKANRSILSGKTCGQVRAWAQASMQGRWDKAGRPDWVKRYAGPQPATVPAPKPAQPVPTKAPTGGEATASGAVVVGGGAVAVGVSEGWGWLEWTLTALVLLAVCAGAFYGWRWWKARKARAAAIDQDGTQAVAESLDIQPGEPTSWISTGSQLPASSPPSLQSLEPSSEQLSAARLALSSVDSPAAPSPRPSAPKQPRKRSAKPSPKTRKQPTSSRVSKSSAVKKSSRKRKPKSRARNSKG